MKSILNAEFKYTNAADSSKPGYLARKFAQYRKQIEAEKARAEAEDKAKVRRIGKAAP